MTSPIHVCMLASENDVIPGGKVGGIGDVVRDIPKALAKQGARVSVVIPAYGAFHLLPESSLVGAFTAEFRGRPERIELFELFAGRDEGVRYLVLHHPLFAAGGPGAVYCDDDASQPFATDANKFALFCIASLRAIKVGLLDHIDVLHLHDWHSALATVLIQFDPEFQSLQSVHCVFSIHNLALQGIRPFAQSASSLEGWFPHLHYDRSQLSDPRWPHCINPIAAAIRYADRVHTVSPTYAQEIILANDPSRGFHGGEGLEQDLSDCAKSHRLVGIINGIDYPDDDISTRRDAISWANFMFDVSDEMLRMMGTQSTIKTADYLAHQRLLRWQSKPMPNHIVTSVGRLTDQKMALLLHPLADGRTPLEALLETLHNRGLLMMLGTGDKELEQACQRLATKHPNFLFFKQYSQRLSDLLFSNGDIFLMPSSFEPCGISQMLSMRQAQPCLAHAVGGLKDTIKDGETGYLFSGNSMTEQATALLERFDDILLQRETQPAKFAKISTAAKQERFMWHDSAKRYLSELYT